MSLYFPHSDALRDPLDCFTDREQILGLFEQFLRSAQPGRFRLLAIKGNSGTGKTFLISYLADRICSQLKWQSGQMSFSQSKPNFRTILATLEQTLESCVPDDSFMRYSERRNEYNRRFDEDRASIKFSPSVSASDYASISGVNQSLHVNVDLREREIQLRYELTGALKELSKETQHPLCLFIDSYERLAESDPEFLGWLWEEVLFGLAKAVSKPLLVVTCGWEYPKNTTIKPLSYSAELTDFDITQMRGYLEKMEVIPIVDPTPAESQELTGAFYELTKGHPLVLSLAVTYFNQLSVQERTAKSLQANRLLVDEHARVEFLEERLLSHLPEPYRTLLERGPVLRSIDQAALQVLLNIPMGNTKAPVSKLDERSYSRFLQYPFINHISTSDMGSPTLQSTFHDLVRRVRLTALRSHSPAAKERLHLTIADYYSQITEMERKTAPLKGAAAGDAESEMPKKEFQVRLEYLYHALQVSSLQMDAFEEWSNLVGQTVIKSRQRAEMLLAIVEQLEGEGEPFLSKSSTHYARYLLWYSRSLSGSGRWEDALAILGRVARFLGREGIAAHFTEFLRDIDVGEPRYVHEVNASYVREGMGKILDYFEQAQSLSNELGNSSAFAQSLDEESMIYVSKMYMYAGKLSTYKEQVSDPAKIGHDLHYVGSVFQNNGMLEEALAYYNRALTVAQRVGDLENAALNLNSIGYVYRDLSDLEQALSYFKQALELSKQAGNPTNQAICLNTIGDLYFAQGKTDQALSSYLESLPYCIQGGDMGIIAATVLEIGSLYQSQGNLEQALVFFNRALAVSERSGNGAMLTKSFERLASFYELTGDMVTSARYLNNIGYMYYSIGKIDQASDYYERALYLSQQEKDALGIALCFNNIGLLHSSQGRAELALDYYMRALPFFKQANDPFHYAITYDNIGSIYYDQKQLEQALSYCKQALALFEQGDYPTDTAMCLTRLGTIYEAQEELEQALNYYKRSLALYERIGNNVEIAKLANTIGSIYYFQEKREQALKYLEQALSHYEQQKQINDPGAIARCLRKIGNIYYYQGNAERALKHFHRSLYLYVSFYLEIGDNTQMGQLYNDIGTLYYNQGNVEQALEHFELALPQIKLTNDPVLLATCLHRTGRVYRRQSDWLKALDYFEQALPLFEQNGDVKDIADCLYDIGFSWMMQNKWEQALDYFKRALPFFEQMNSSTDMVNFLNHMSYVYAALGKLEEALSYAQRVLAVFSGKSEFSSEDRRLHATFLYNVGNIYYRQKKFAQAIEQYSQSLTLLERLGDSLEMLSVRVLEGLSGCYDQLGEPKKSLEYRERAQQIRQDSQKTP